MLSDLVRGYLVVAMMMDELNLPPSDDKLNATFGMVLSSLAVVTAIIWGFVLNSPLWVMLLNALLGVCIFLPLGIWIQKLFDSALVAVIVKRRIERELKLLEEFEKQQEAEQEEASSGASNVGEDEGIAIAAPVILDEQPPPPPGTAAAMAGEPPPLPKRRRTKRSAPKQAPSFEAQEPPEG